MTYARLIHRITVVATPVLKSGLLLIVLALPILAGTAVATFPDGQKPDSGRRVEIDRLFKDLMTTLPVAARVQVDSVRAGRHPVVSSGTAGEKNRTATVTTPNTSSNAAFHALSPQLRLQVLDAMSEIQRRQEMRHLEFRDGKPCQFCPNNK